MRLYTFVNGLYMGPKQYGIQSMHVLGEMIADFAPENDESWEARTQADYIRYCHLRLWAREGKTVIIKSAVNCAGLRTVWNTINTINPPYIFTQFHEDEDSLDGALTSVGIIVPEHVAQAADHKRNGGTWDIIDWDPESTVRVEYEGTILHDYDLALIDLLNNYSLA